MKKLTAILAALLLAALAVPLAVTVLFANAKSLDAGLTPAYAVSGGSVEWDCSANGYRLPTEAGGSLPAVPE